MTRTTFGGELRAWRPIMRTAARRCWQAWRGHLVLTLLTALVLAAYLLWQGFIQAESGGALLQVARWDLPGDAMLQMSPDTAPPTIAANIGKLQGDWLVHHAETPIGEWELAAMTDGNVLPLPQAGEVYLPDTLGSAERTALGDAFLLRINSNGFWREVPVQVGGTYTPHGPVDPLVVLGTWLNSQLEFGQPLGRNAVYTANPLYPAELAVWCKTLASGITVITAEQPRVVASRVTSLTYRQSGSAIMLVLLFLIIGVGTFALLQFLDSKREFSVLKSIGVRSREVARLLPLELFVPALGGYLLAAIATPVVAHALGLPVPTDLGIYGRAALLVLLCYAVAVAWPSALVFQASVNELLLDRPIPVWRRTLTGLTRHHPVLAERLALGYACLQLPTDGGHFPGILLRHAGDHVREGETLAWESQWGGLLERSFVAPCSGQIVELDASSGIVCIAPDTH